MTDEQNTLAYALASLRRAADNDYSWSVTQSEASVLVAEVERLHAGLLDIEQIVRDGMGVARAAGRDEERAAVVAYLRELGAINSMLSPMKGAVDDIERGEHRREENE